MLERGADRGQQVCAAFIDRVERACANQRLDRAAIDAAFVDTPAEIEQIAKRTCLPRHDNCLDRGLAGAFDGAQAIAHVFVVDRLETVARLVDVGRQHGKPKRDRIVVQVAHLVGVVHHQRQVRRHECRGMMRLEIRGLIRDQRISRGVRLVEAVARELFHQIEKLRCFRRRKPPVDCTGDEALAVLGHFVGQLLAHRAAQEIGCTQRVAADHLRDLHHLFLIDHHAVGG